VQWVNASYKCGTESGDRTQSQIGLVRLGLGLVEFDCVRFRVNNTIVIHNFRK